METLMTQKKMNATFAIASILVASLFFNQWLGNTVAQPSKDVSRGIASVSPNSEDYADKVKWEHKLADHIGTDKRAIASLAVKPTLRDELLFGTLAGRYGSVIKGGRFMSLEYSSAKAQGLPVAIASGEKFLMKFKDLWAADFSEAKLESKESQREIYNLTNSSGEKAALAHLDFDRDGNLLSVKITH
jgi:hypothetical protein